jgi:hypothetical protein
MRYTCLAWINETVETEVCFPVGLCQTPSIRDDPYTGISRENSLELIELSSINKVSLV